MISKFLKGKDCLYFIVGNCLCRYRDKECKVIYENSSAFTRACCTNGDLVALTDFDKKVIIYKNNAASVLGTLEKVPFCAYLKDDSLYIADKFGDIILFDQNNNKGTVIAGCLSIITDLLVTEDLIYVADRDEKIRILDRKAPFLIKSFLLEHEQYIFALEMYKNVLISLGSDGKLIFWSDEKVILEFGKGDPLTISIDEEREEIAFGVKNEDGCFLFKWRNDAGVLVSEKLDFDLTSMVHWDGELILAGYKDGQPFVKGIPGFVEFVPSLNLKADACNLNHHLEHLRKRLKN